MKAMFLLISHLGIGALGFALGIYALPILTAVDGPSAAEMAAAKQQTQFTGEFKRDLAGSDFFHWGEAKVSVGKDFISWEGKIAPGPDYRLYLAPEFVETELEFQTLQAQAVEIAEVKTFEDAVIRVPESVDPAQYNTVVIWCETFQEFITAAQYQQDRFRTGE